MPKIEIIMISVSAITAIAGIILGIKNLIDTRKKYYEEFQKNRKRKTK